MLKRLIQLVIAAVVIYAGWHAGVVYVNYYQFNDELGQMALFAKGTATESELKDRVLEVAQQYEIPLDPDAVVVHHDRDLTQITAPYVAEVKLLPNYIYRWKLEAKGSAVHLGAP